MILFVKDDGRAGLFEWFPGICHWLYSVDLTCPLFKLAVRGMQRGAAIDVHGLCSFLKFLVTRLIVFFAIIIFWIFVTAPGGPLLLFIYAATARLAVTLLAGPLSTVLAFLLLPPLIFSPLLLSKELNLSAVLEIMAFGAMDLAVLLDRVF